MVANPTRALNTSDFFGFRSFFGFHFEYGLITDETYSRRQINTGTKCEVSHLHNIFVDIGQSGPHPWPSYQNDQYNNDEVLFLVRTVNEKVNPLRLQ